MTHPIFERNGTTPPRRPTLADFGGREFESVLRYLPNDKRRVPLNGYLQAAMAIDRVCRSIPLLSVDFQTAAYPGTGTILFVNSVVDGLTSSTITLTQAATGRFRIAWPAGTLPAKVHLTDSSHIGSLHPSFGCFVEHNLNNCLVYCYTFDGEFVNSADYKFNITLWGG